MLCDTGYAMDEMKKNLTTLRTKYKSPAPHLAPSSPTVLNLYYAGG